MKLKNILRRGGGGGGDGKTKKSSSPSDNNHTKNADIRATNTGSTASHSSSGSGGMVSDVPHGSGIFVDTTRHNGGADTLGYQMNDVVVAINKTPRKTPQHNSTNKNTRNQRKPPSKKSASASLPHLEFGEILQAGYSLLSCMAQCRPMSNATTSSEIPTMIDPALNEDNHTVGELTLLTIEKEEQRREMISAAKDRAAEITAGIVGMGFPTTAAAANYTMAAAATGSNVNRHKPNHMNAAVSAPSGLYLGNHQRKQNIGSLLDNVEGMPNANAMGESMQSKANALLQKANTHHHTYAAVKKQHSVDDTASFNMTPANLDDVCVAKTAPEEKFVGRFGPRPSDIDSHDDSSYDEDDCDSIDGQIGRW